MVTCGYALVDPTVCWVESRQRAAKPPVQYSHYTEIHQYLSVYGDPGSCVDTTLISITSYKGNRYFLLFIDDYNCSYRCPTTCLNIYIL